VADRVPVDEGRIHEWLDGQLSAAEGAELEALVANDPEWSAALADARGVIAATRRITGALDEVAADVIPLARPKTGSMEVRALPSRPIQANARRPRFMLRTWRNAAAMLVVFVGSGVVWRITRQEPSINAGERVASAAPALVPPAAAPAPEAASGPLVVDAPRLRISDSALRSAAERQARSQADEAQPTAMADATPMSVGGQRSSQASQPSPQAAEAAAPPPSVMVPRVAQADSAASTNRELKATDAFSARAAAAPSAGNGGANAIAARRAEGSIAGLGERCVEASLFNPPEGWPTRVALEVDALGNGQMMAFLQFSGPVGGRWIGSGWRRATGGEVEVAPVQVAGTLTLSLSAARNSQGRTVGVLWGACSTRQ
jgi:hypothetical protein